jgi:predicted  nucleic acid-binding Zn-ribbon protein
MWPAPGLAAPYNPELTKEQELELLKNQAKYFEETLTDINQRLKDLEGS